ncbi:MAG: hydrogenase, partial [Pirellulaceae bacterium]
MSLQKNAIFGDPTEILLALSGKHHLPELLPLAVRLLAPDENVALVRIWLVRPPEEGECLSCPMAGGCHHRQRCL